MTAGDSDYSFALPTDFDECFFEEKGWCRVELYWKSRTYQINFYDPYRLNQEIEDALARGSMFVDENLVVVEKVTKRNLELAIADLVARSEVKKFTPKT